MAGAVKGTFRDKLFQEIRLESLAYRRWSRKLIFFHKIMLGLWLSNFQEYLNLCRNERTYSTQSSKESENLFHRN